MKEVKEEVFGSRNSNLKDLFVNNGIDFISGIWVVTCIRSINKDVKSRYLICIEGDRYDQSIDGLISRVKNNVSAIHVKFNQDKETVFVKNLRTEQASDISYSQFKQRIIELTKCKYYKSFAQGSSESTPLSRFFRENMGKGFALTDVDFYLTSKKLFIEEKNFVVENKGYLGVGQCISFKEITNDLFSDISLKIVCASEEMFYLADFSNINCYNQKQIPRWGNMVEFDVEQISKIEFLKLLKDE